MAADEAKDPDLLEELAYRLSNLGIIYNGKLADPTKTLAFWSEALEYKDALFQQFPDYTPQSRNRRGAFVRLADRVAMVLMERGDFEQAEAQLRRALNEQKLKLGVYEGPRERTLESLFKVLEATQQLDEAKRLWQECRERVQVNDFSWQLSPDRPATEYRIRIEQPGEYQLYVRWGVDDALYRKNSVGLIATSLSHGDRRLEDWYQLERGPGEAEFFTPLRWSTFEITWERHRTPPSPMLWRIDTAGEYVLRIHVQHAGAYVDALVLQKSDLPAPQGSGPAESPVPADGVFLPRDGRFVIEAENYSDRTHEDDATAWRILPSESSVDREHPEYRGPGYIRSDPVPIATEEESAGQSSLDALSPIDSNSAAIEPHPPDS